MKRLLFSVPWLLASALFVRADATLVFNEIMYHPATNEPALEWVELYNQLAVDLDVSGWRISGDIDYRFPANTRVAGRGLVVVAIDPPALVAMTGLPDVLGPFSNRLSNAGGTLRLRNNNDRVVDEITYGTEGDWPVAPDGAGPSLAKLDEDLGSADPVHWQASRRLGGTPGLHNQPRLIYTTTTRTLVPLDQTWKYDQSGGNLGTAWKEPGFDDSTWPSGRGLLAFENNSLVTPLTNTVLSLTNPAGQRVLTYYFRTHFTFTNDPARFSLFAANLLDDGVVVYLNGTEVYRYRVPEGQNHQTLAENQANEGAFENISFSTAALRSGDNVLAAEVHQVNNTSSDVVFGLRLDDVTTATNLPPEIAPLLPVVFNEMSSVTNAQFWIEILNTSSETVALEGCVLARFGTTNREYVIPSQTLPAGGFLVLDRAMLGFGADPGDRVILYGPGKSNVLDAVVAKRYPRARLPEGSGPWLHPDRVTPGAPNSFALHDEIVINEIMYHHKPFPATNDLPAQPNPEEWVELYNRGTNAVDLGGWELEGGLRYTFSAGTILAPDAYLVIAKDAAALRAAWPGIVVLGDYSGRLSSKGERLFLRDAAGNPADEVHYYGFGRWAEYADGGGSSLELRDPHADNAVAEAWAASDETGRSDWQTVSYQMVAQASPTPNPDGIWRELVLGLLAAGECLIDDLSVVQSPSNSPVQMIANGGFENGLTGWRVLGTHGRSRVEADPLDPGNHVLRVSATGPQEHMHNHIETTLAGGLSVANGQIYQISYRAKWLAGNSLLNTRLYFNRVARTTELRVPQRNGTPGARNSRYAANIGPTFSGLQHEPVVPPAGASVAVSVRATDPQGVADCQLFWSANGGAFASTAMTRQPDGHYRGTIPGAAAGTTVQFYVRATDGLGAASLFPARGSDSGAFYKVNDGQADLRLTHNLRMLTTPAHAALLHADTNVMSNDNLPCTLIYDERVAYYDVGLRLKASMNGRPHSSRVGFHLAFQPDQLFRGVHPAMGMDRRPGDNLPRNEEIVVRHAALAAGGIPTMQMDICRVLAPRSSENGPAILTASYEDNFIETAFENGADGMLHEMEGIYYPRSANADGYKLPQPNSTQYIDLADHGEDKERYRYHWILKRHRNADDYRQLINLAKSFSLSGTVLETQTRQLADLDQWLRAYALITLFGVNDTYTFWLNHNLMIYFRPSDHKAVYLMWDNDFAFARSATSAIVGDQNLGRIINLPGNLRVLYAQMLDLIETTYNPEYMGYWLAHFGPLSGADYTSRTTYIQQRTDYVRNVIAGAGGNTPFSINATNLTVVSGNVATLSGRAPVAVQSITVNGVAWPVTWTTISSWTLRVPLPLATNHVQIAGLDLHGNPVSTASASATVVVNAASDSPVGKVLFNEIMHHADVPEAEYVELFNSSAHTTFDLSGWRVNGLSYTFPPGTSIGPRSYLVLVKNRAVFVATYGSPVGWLDEFAGELQQNGETLTLVQPGALPGEEIIIDQVRYEGGLPWPPAADGTGSSYQLIDANQDNRRAGNWYSHHVPAVYSGGINEPARTNVGWRFVSLTGNIGWGVGGGQQRLLIYLGESDGASAIVDDVCLVAGTEPAVGENFIRNGNFELAPLLEEPFLTNSWVVSTNYTNSFITGEVVHSGSGALQVVCSTFGNIHGRVISQNLSPAPPPNTTNTLSFWFWSTNSATNLFVRMQNSAALTTGGSGTNILPGITPAIYIPPTLVSPAVVTRSPGMANPVSATLPAFPPLWINEVQAENRSGIMDAPGEREPWIELYNPSSNSVLLAGLYLSDTFANLTRWSFPAGRQIGPGQFLVIFCDAQPPQTTAGELHAGFRLAPGSGSVALSRLHNGQPQVLDYMNYGGLDPDRSFGSYPDGDPMGRRLFHYVTPGGPNDGRIAPPTVFINEWMAANSRAFTDPADGDYDDWFELYNPGTNAVDLAGFYLTDTLTNPFKCRITTNGAHLIPPHGYLLVWADEETGQNVVNGVARADLHVNFKLATAGEEIGLFGEDGTQIDAIAFGLQTDDVSAGRYPDGNANIVVMPGTASPRAANYLASSGNTPPVLAAIGNRVIFLGQTLAFNAMAADDDVPQQALAFSLDPAPPAGAVITGTGVFEWMPVMAGSFSVTVRVTDDGVPPLSDFETIWVLVLNVPAFDAAVRHGSQIEMNWQTEPGQLYVVDFKDALDAPTWTPLWTNLAVGTSLSFTNSAGSAPQRFFRIRAGLNTSTP